MIRQNEDDPITRDQLFWFFVTAYVLHATGLLAKEKEERLDLIEAYGWGNWREYVKQVLEVDEGFIRSVYAFCTEFKSRQKAIGFILRGFGCPSVEERIAEHPEIVELEK